MCTSKFSLKRLCLLSVLILCSLFISENTFSRKHWDRNYIYITYNDSEGAINIVFKFFDFRFGPANEHGFLDIAQFYYSTNSYEWIKFMTAKTVDQTFTCSAWIEMNDKLKDAQLQFCECFIPKDGTMWKNNTSEKIQVYINSSVARLRVKWFVGEKYKNIKHIGVSGVWRINDLRTKDPIPYVVFNVNIPRHTPFHSDMNANSK